jgi:hypothetical protein
MHTIRTLFGGLDIGDTFIYGDTVYKKSSAHKALNCQTMRMRAFKLDHLVEVTPN